MTKQTSTYENGGSFFALPGWEVQPRKRQKVEDDLLIKKLEDAKEARAKKDAAKQDAAGRGGK